MNYSDKLKDPRWQRRRLEIMKRDNFSCVNCGDKETQLQIHHLEYSSNPWDIEDDKLITLCEPCHGEFTRINSEIKLILSSIVAVDVMEEILSFLKIAHRSNPFDIQTSIDFLKFIKISDYKVVLSFESFMKKFKELSDGRMD